MSADDWLSEWLRESPATSDECIMGWPAQTTHTTHQKEREKERTAILSKSLPPPSQNVYLHHYHKNYHVITNATQYKHSLVLTYTAFPYTGPEEVTVTERLFSGGRREIAGVGVRPHQLRGKVQRGDIVISWDKIQYNKKRNRKKDTHTHTHAYIHTYIHTHSCTHPGKPVFESRAAPWRYWVVWWQWCGRGGGREPCAETPQLPRSPPPMPAPSPGQSRLTPHQDTTAGPVWVGFLVVNIPN